MLFDVTLTDDFYNIRSRVSSVILTTSLYEIKEKNVKIIDKYMYLTNGQECDLWQGMDDLYIFLVILI